MSYTHPYALNVIFHHGSGYVAPQPDAVVFGTPPPPIYQHDLGNINYQIAVTGVFAPQKYVAFELFSDVAANAIAAPQEATPFYTDCFFYSDASITAYLNDITIHGALSLYTDIPLSLGLLYDSFFVYGAAVGAINYESLELIEGEFLTPVSFSFSSTVTRQSPLLNTVIPLLPPNSSSNIIIKTGKNETSAIDNDTKIVYNASKETNTGVNFLCINERCELSNIFYGRLNSLITKSKNTDANWGALCTLKKSLVGHLLGSVFLDKKLKTLYEHFSVCDSDARLIKYDRAKRINKKHVIQNKKNTSEVIGVFTGVWTKGVSRGLFLNAVFVPRCHLSAAIIFPTDPPNPPDPNEINILPINDCYFMINSTEVKIYPENTPINADNISLSIDDSSFVWRASFNIFDNDTANVLLPAVGNKEVLITANGHSFLIVVENISKSISFKGASYGVSGRGVAAYLTTPFVTTRSYIQSDDNYTAHQLAENELVGFQDWTVDWQVTANPFVPIGTFKYNDKTPVAAISYIAEGVGGFLQADKLNKVLRVISRYKYSPWTWYLQTPNFYVPKNIIISDSITKQVEPLYNRIYCIGETNGIIMDVTRSGTAGDIIKEQFLHPLICDTSNGIETGRIELAQSGVSYTHSMSLPLPQSSEVPDLMLPGTLIEVQNLDDSSWIGQNKSLSINASFSGGTRQVIEIEERYV